MGWAVGYDSRWRRDIGYGVPSVCDAPGCQEAIDRGLSYVCGGEPYGGDYGCGLFFCEKHRHCTARRPERCARCIAGKPPYKRPKPDTEEWERHKLTDDSWQPWRDENPAEVVTLRSRWPDA